MQPLNEVNEELRKIFPSGHPDFIPLMTSLMKLHSDKNADYARGGNPLGNFYRVSDMLKAAGINLSPAQVAFVYMMKQVDAAGRMLGLGYEGSVEGLDKRLEDVVVYGNLVRILAKESRAPISCGNCCNCYE